MEKGDWCDFYISSDELEGRSLISYCTIRVVSVMGEISDTFRYSEIIDSTSSVPFFFFQCQVRLLHNLSLNMAYNFTITLRIHNHRSQEAIPIYRGLGAVNKAVLYLP